MAIEDFVLPGSARIAVSGYPGVSGVHPLCSFVDHTFTYTNETQTGNVTNCADPRKPGDAFRLVQGDNKTLSGTGQFMVKEFDFAMDWVDNNRERIVFYQSFVDPVDPTSSKAFEVFGRAALDSLTLTSSQGGVMTAQANFFFLTLNYVSDLADS